jgi:hypothetical protein
MTLTLLLCAAVIVFTALCVGTKPFDANATVVLDEKPPLPLSDPSVEALTGNSGTALPVVSEWHVIQVDTLRDAEDVLDSLEAQGVEHRELIILGNATFAVRWR